MVFVSSVMESVTGEPIELSGDKKCAITMFTPHKHYVRMCNISQLSVPYHDSIQTLYSAATTLLSHLFQKAKLQTGTTKRLISWRMRS